MTERILEGPNFQTTVPKLTLGQLCFYNADKFGDKICQVDGSLDATETFASVKIRSTRVALALQARQVKPKDVIAFCCNSSLDGVIPLLATFYLGAKAANLAPSVSIRQTSHLISLVSPRIIFADEESVGLIESSLRELDLDAEIIVLGASSKYPTFSQLSVPKANEASFKPIEVELDEVALLFFSSGTTGLPKAICHTHKSFLNTVYAISECKLGDVVFHFKSFHWVTAHYMLFYSFIKGKPRAFVRSVEGSTIFKTIEKYKVSSMLLAPVLTKQLTSTPNVSSYDTSSLQTIFCVGITMTPSQHKELTKTFTHTHITTIYAMTETGVITIFDPDIHSVFIKDKPTSSGKAHCGMKIKIVDEDGSTILGPNQRGEIRLKSSTLLVGYYNSDFSDSLDEDGYLKTGDVGYYDEDECLYIVSRIKEMFKYQATQIVPASIESVLLEHPAVKEAVVFGVPWGDEGEAPAACIVLEENVDVSAREIQEFVAGTVTEREKLTGGITFVKYLPRTPTGKVIRKQVRDSIIKNL